MQFGLWAADCVGASAPAGCPLLPHPARGLGKVRHVVEATREARACSARMRSARLPLPSPLPTDAACCLPAPLPWSRTLSSARIAAMGEPEASSTDLTPTTS